MFSLESIKEEAWVTELAVAIKNHNTDISAIYYIPKELTETVPAVVFKDIKNRMDMFYLHTAVGSKGSEVLAFYESAGHLFGAAKKFEAARMGEVREKPVVVPEFVTRIVEELAETGGTSVIKSEVKKEIQLWMDEKKEVLNYVLGRIGDKAARSNKRGFFVADKLDAIEMLLKESESSYHVIYKSPHCVLYGKAELEEGRKAVLVSSHADIVNQITAPYSSCADGFYHGTYDNLGTNAAATAIMLSDSGLADNVYFAFTDEEESGRCLGAGECAKLLRGLTKKKPFCISLDVTDEGYGENRLCSVEGLSAKERSKTAVKNSMFATEPDRVKSFCVAKKEYKDNSPFPADYITCSYTVYDESAHYAGLNYETLSFCLPTTGSMHSDRGLYVKEPAFLGYILSLEAFLHSYCKDKLPLFGYAVAKEMLVEKTIETRRTATKEAGSFPAYDYGGDDYEDGYDEDGEFFYDDSEKYDELAELALMYPPGALQDFLEDVDFSYGADYISGTEAKSVFIHVHEQYWKSAPGNEDDYDCEYDDYDS